MRKAVNHLKKSDPILRAIIERVGPCRMEFGVPEFHSLAEAIVYQQLNGKAAVTIFKRFAALAGEPLTPQGILKLTDAQMRSVGLSKQKSSYLKDLVGEDGGGLAGLCHAKGPVRRRRDQAPDAGEGHRRVDSADVPDVFPAAAKRAAHRRLRHPDGHEEALQETQTAETEGDGEDRAAWEPYRSVACWYLWRSLDIKTV